jgi:DNA polymerase III gamma/tau subunit
MLSVAAFNALLKNLEEPPPNTVFILATTDPQKIPETVLSRCQKYDFRAMSLETIERKLREIAEVESIDVEPEVFSLVARLADGSMRDAQSLMERVRSLSDGKITAEDASQALGVVKRSLLSDISKGVFSHNADDCLKFIGEAFSGGLDPRLFLNEFVSHWRELLIAKFSGASGLSRIGLSKEAHKELLTQVEGVGPADLQDLVYLAQQGCEQATRSLYPRIALEALVVRMATREPVVEVAKVIESLKKKDLKSPSVKPGLTEVAPTVSAARLSAARQPAVAPIPQQVVRAKVAVKEEVSAQSVSVQNQDSNLRPVGSLKWRDFVDSVNKSGRAGIMNEYLKRLSVESFEPGRLKAAAPKIAQEYFKDADNKSKLVDFLNRYFKAADWEIRFSEAANQVAVTSIMEEDKRAQVSAQVKQKENATEHPAILNIKKFFPGSTLG